MTKGFGREYPRGRISGDDEGQLQTKIALDPETNTLIINYGKPVEWIGLDADAATQLIMLLAKHLANMKGVPVSVVIEKPLKHNETWTDRDDDTNLGTLMAYCRSVTAAPDRAVRDESGEVAGYWQTTEWIEGLLALCEAGEHDD